VVERSETRSHRSANCWSLWHARIACVEAHSGGGQPAIVIRAQLQSSCGRPNVLRFSTPCGLMCCVIYGIVPSATARVARYGVPKSPRQMADPPPSTSSSHDITRLLREAQDGRESAKHELVSLVYLELHGLASHFMRNERDDHTLQPTALVHE